MLPVEVPPEARESLPAWLQRIAAFLRVDVGLLYAHLGLRPRGRTIRYLHLALPSQRVEQVCARTGIRKERVGSTLVDSFPGVDLTVLTDSTKPVPDRDAQRGQWMFFSGSRWCPRCVAAGEPWRVEWQLPWAVVCQLHGVLLLDRCPECGRRPDLRAPANAAHPLARLVSCQCGYRWERAPSRAVPPTSDLGSMQTELLGALGGAQGALWGVPLDGFHLLAAWRAAGALAVSTGAVPPWARRPYLVPPPDAAGMAHLLLRVCPLIHAPDLDSAVAQFALLAAGARGRDRDTVWGHIPNDTPLAPVARLWLRDRGRLHAQLRRTRQDALELLDIDLRSVPTLAPANVLPDRWRAAAVPALPMRRAALALAVARLAGAGTWGDAGASLGIDPDYASRVVRHTLRTVGPGSAQELTAAAFRFARSLERDARLVTRPDGAPLRSARELSAWAQLEALKR